MNPFDAKQLLVEVAKNGDRVVHVTEPKPKTIWGGLGNRSGLHSFADTLIREKWEKSGERFKKKLDKILKPGEKFEIQTFRNVTRDRGRWMKERSFTLI